MSNREEASLQEALDAGTFITLSGETFRIDANDQGEMYEDCEETCLFVTDENTGEEYQYTFDELGEYLADRNLEVLVLQPVYISK